MKLIAIYKCLCDETRLRILNLLSVSPLCVCHLQQVLGKPQVIVSQHLARLRARGMVAGRRHQQWMIYSLPAVVSAGLEANLKCLQDCVQTEPVFKKDRAKLGKLMGSKSVRDLLKEGCCPVSENKSNEYQKTNRSNSLHRKLLPQPHGRGHPAPCGGRSV